MTDRLVTLIGGGGFIGRYLAQELLRAGVRVRIAQRRPARATFLKPLAGVGQIQFAAADIAQPETLDRACAGADAVVNLVGAWKNFDAVHVQGAQHAAQAARRAGARAFVQISALGADANAPSAYGQSKAAGERAVRDAFPTATILRPSTVFGREDAFVNRFAAMISALPVVPILRPDAKFQPVYVVDVAEAAAAALADPGSHGGVTYSLGGPDVLTMAALHHRIARLTGRDPTFLPLPDAVGGLLSIVPGGPITSDQWRMLQVDNVVPEGVPGLSDLGVRATPLAAVAPDWLVRYRRQGRFGSLNEAA